MVVPKHTRIPYLPALDGIRAVAIFGVLVFHVSPAALTGGFVGVDVFFVLSGFLITSILLADLRDGRFSAREFYLRRVQRLLPNIVATILGSLLLWLWLMPPGSATALGRSGIWALANLSNFYVWKSLGDYWGGGAAWAPLTHTWSLGVEEQFYLLYPGALWLLHRLQPRRLFTWIGLVTAVSFIACIYGTAVHPTAAFYLLPTRIWELLLGALVSIYRTRTDVPPFSRAWGWIGLAGILASFFLIGASSAFPGWVALAPTVGTVALLLSIVSGPTAVSRFLSARFLIGVGKRSYSLYLWHWPLIIVGKTEAALYGWSETTGAAIGCIGGMVLGCAAYAWIEQPLRHRSVGRAWRLSAIASGFAAAAALCWIAAARSVPVDSNHEFTTPSFSGQLYNAGRPNLEREEMVRRFAGVELPPLPASQVDRWKQGGIVHRFGGGDPRVVVLGSSHALMYSGLIDEICQAKGISVAFLGVGYATPAFFEATTNINFPSGEEAKAFDEARKHWLGLWHPAAVFLIDRWDRRFESPADFEGRLRSCFRTVAPLTSHLVFVAQVPVATALDPKISFRAYVAWRRSKTERLLQLLPDDKQPLRDRSVVLAEAARVDFPSLSVLRPDRLFYQAGGTIRYGDGKILFYADDNHLTDQGAAQARALFEQAIAAAVGR